MKDFKFILIILALAFIGTFIVCSNKGISGKYVSEKNPRYYIELDSDGTFFIQEGKVGLTGEYEVKGTRITLKSDTGFASRATLEGHSLIDKDGERWTKRDNSTAKTIPAPVHENEPPQGPSEKATHRNLPSEPPTNSSGASPHIQIDNQSAPYLLAEKLSATIPALAPESRTILAEAKSFEISAYEAIFSLYNNQGSRASQLNTLGFDQLKQIILNAVRNLGERRLITEAAKQASLFVTTEEVEKILQNEYSRAGGEDIYAASLRTEGISLDFVKQKTNETLLINKYLAQISNSAVTNAVSVPSQTATVRHILLITQGKSETNKNDIRKKAEDLLRRAKSGEDFAQLARQYSEDTGSKDNGGLYESFTRGVMVKAFEEAAFSIPVGEIGEIVETQFGYHIIKVIGRTGPAQATNEATLRQDANTIQDHIDLLKENAGFQIYADRLERYAARQKR